MTSNTVKSMLANQKSGTSMLRKASQKSGFISGEKVFLEGLSMSHFSEQYVDWLNDSVVCRENRHGVFPYTAEDLKKYLKAASSSRDAAHFAIRLKKNNRHIGNVGLVNISWIDRSVELAILIGDKSVWGTGVGSEVCRLVKDYCFDRLNMHRVWMGMTVTNKPMIKIAESLGMKKEGYFKDALYKEGRFLDVVQYSVLRK